MHPWCSVVCAALCWRAEAGARQRSNDDLVATLASRLAQVEQQNKTLRQHHLGTRTSFLRFGCSQAQVPSNLRPALVALAPSHETTAHNCNDEQHDSAEDEPNSNRSAFFIRCLSVFISLNFLASITNLIQHVPGAVLVAAFAIFEVHRPPTHVLRSRFKINGHFSHPLG